MYENLKNLDSYSDIELANLISKLESEVKRRKDKTKTIYVVSQVLGFVGYFKDEVAAINYYKESILEANTFETLTQFSIDKREVSLEDYNMLCDYNMMS